MDFWLLIKFAVIYHLYHVLRSSSPFCLASQTVTWEKIRYRIGSYWKAGRVADMILSDSIDWTLRKQNCWQLLHSQHTFIWQLIAGLEYPSYILKRCFRKRYSSILPKQMSPLSTSVMLTDSFALDNLQRNCCTIMKWAHIFLFLPWSLCVGIVIRQYSAL